MPKLLIVTTVASTLKAFLLPYARHFRAMGWTVDAMAYGVNDCEDCLAAFDSCYEIAFTRKPWELKNLRSLNESIRSLIAERSYDIVHVHTPVAAFVTRLALRKISSKQRPKVVYTAHGFHFYRGGKRIPNALYLTLEKIASRWTDHLIVINEEDYQAAMQHSLVPKARLSLLPGIGLDLREWDRKNIPIQGVREFYEKLNLQNDDQLFLMVAEFNPGKRHKDVIDALRFTGSPHFHLAFAGQGPLEGEMKNRVQKLGLASQVHFLGQRSDIPILLLASTALILPSEREGLNRSVMESIALGVPVLGADARGIRDLITTPERGRLFPVGNPAALAATLLMFVKDKTPNMPRPQPDPKWDIAHLLKEHEHLYSSLLNVN